MKNILKKMSLVVLMAVLTGNAFMTLAEEIPAPEVTQAPVEATAAPEIEVTPAPAEATEAPVEVTVTPEAEVTPAPTETAPVAFTGEVSVKMENGGEIFFGDTVTLRAVVSNANADYSIRWEVNKEGSGDSWKVLSGETKSTYSFQVNEENAAYAYRAVLVVAE